MLIIIINNSSSSSSIIIIIITISISITTHVTSSATHLHYGISQLGTRHSAAERRRGVTICDVGQQLQAELARIQRRCKGVMLHANVEKK
jgi:hypothetical protein